MKPDGFIPFNYLLFDQLKYFPFTSLLYFLIGFTMK